MDQKKQQQDKEYEPRSSLMLTERRRYLLQTPVQKVLGFCPMYNKTAIILAIKSHRKQSVIHLSQQGKIIKQKQYQTLGLYPFVVTSIKQVVWLSIDEDLLLQWNLETNQFIELPFPFLDEADSHEVFYFPKTQLLCVAQWGRHNSNAFRLTYYNYPVNNLSQPIHSFLSYQSWTHQYMVKKGNQKSMFIWFRSNQRAQFQFKTYQLLDRKQNKWIGQQKINRIPLKIKNEQDSYQLSIACICQMTPKKYMILGLINKENQNYINSMLVYEENKQVLRYARFSLYQKFAIQIVDYQCFGDTMMLKTFDFKQGKAQQTPIYYIDRISQSIIAKSSWRCSHLNKYSLPGYDKNLIIDAEYQNFNVRQINCYFNKVAQHEYLTAFMITELIENVNPFLLCDIIGLLKSQI